MTHAGHRAYKVADQRNRPGDPLDPALRRTARLCRFHSEAEKELFDIAKHLDVDVRELLVSTKNVNL